MIVTEKPPLPGDEVEFADAPPAYDTLVSPPQPPTQAGGKAPAPAPTPAPNTPSTSALPAITPHPQPPRSPSGWFPFQRTRDARKVRSTVVSLLHDLVTHPQRAQDGALGILQSCADACANYGLSLAALLQQPALEGRTPLYWAITNRSPAPEGGGVDLVAALLAHAVPLAPATLSELRLACLQTSDQALFQQLRRSAALAGGSRTDEIIMGAAAAPPDEVEVEDVGGDEGAFVARVRMPLFQKRMRIARAVGVEFIARGRMWALGFSVVKDDGEWTGGRHLKGGSWVVTLHLMEHSPATWVDSRLVIEDARGVVPESPSGKPKAPIEIRLKQSDPLTAQPLGSTSSLILFPLVDNPMANSLQFNDSSYIGSDGTLQARLEARLTKPESECIIC